MRYEIFHEFPPVEAEAAWRGLMGQLGLPSHYNAPEYFLEPFWTGKQPFAVLTFDGEKAVAVLTGIHDHDQVICGLPTRPQIAVDPNTDLNAALAALLQGLFEEAVQAKLVSVYSWSSLELPAFTARDFRCRQFQGTVVLDLAEGPEALFQQFSKGRRSNIRFAEKHGVSVRIANDHADICRAYDVYLAWHGTKRKKVKGERRTFESFEAAHRLQQNRRLFLAEVSGKVIAINMFRFHSGGLLEYAGNCSIDEFLHLKPNDVLQWKAIEWGCSQGLRRHSLGGADLFHRQFGGTIVPIHRYRIDRTWFRRHDLREYVTESTRKTFHRLPLSAQKGIRRALGRRG
jgi:Acetyltransferase (GNAT) domain